MEKNILKWSCNRSKFGKIVAMHVYKELLGCVFGTTFELEIIYDNEHVKGYPVLEFYLRRDKTQDARNITFKLISSYKMVKNSVVYFGSEQSCIYITKYYPEILPNNYCLDLFFVFHPTNEDNVTFKEDFQIVKLENLSTRFQSMLEKEHMTDVILKCDTLTLKAHKCILSTHSPVFEAMFASPMLENELNTVTIKDIDSSVFRAMVTYMYSGQVKIVSESMAYDLLYTAEKYQIDSLKDGCLEYLKSILSVENAFKILEISNLFDKRLKQYCLSYIKNQFEELKSSNEWKDLKLKCPVLALEIYSYNDSE